MNTMISEKIKTFTEYEAGQSFLVLELLSPCSEEIYSYQIEMVANNPRPSIMPFEVRRKNEKIMLFYNTTSKATLKDFLKHNKFSKPAFTELLLQITSSLIESSNLFLYEKNFIISEDTIYVEPETEIISIIYLPLFVEANHYQRLKDFIINLITKSAIIEMQPEDNYLQRIIEFVKTSEFNLSDLNRLLNNIKNECGVYISNTANVTLTHKQSETASKLIGETRKKKALSLNQKIVINHNNLIKHGNKSIFISLLCQLIVIGIAVSFEYLMQRKLAIDTRYILIGMFVLISDLLIYKFFLRGKAALNKEELKKIEKEKHTRSLSMFKKEMSNAQLISGNKQNNNVDCSKNFGLKAEMEVTKGNDETTVLCERAKKAAYLLNDEQGIAKKIEIHKNRFLIGRNSEVSDFIINEKVIGRIHAEIIIKDGEYFIIDKNSKNGTFIDNERLTKDEEYRLINNSSIVFANKEYKFSIE